jgi:hypothetical protein
LKRLCLVGICVLFLLRTAFSQNVESFGFFVGVNAPFTLDQGMEKDLRYYGKFTLRGTPVGFNYGYDVVGIGILVSPSYLTIGQKFTIKNTQGGGAGTRDVKFNYFSLPVALKVHINDMAFFRLSVVAALNFNVLVSGQETITYPTASKLKFPKGVSVPTDPGYVVSYDGVYVPEEHDRVSTSQDKFNIFQLFGAVGLHSDFDINDDWGINFDGRANFGISDPRNKDYIHELKNPSGPPDIDGKPGAPDLYGQRREVYLSASIGFSRLIQTKKKFVQRHSNQPLQPKPQNNKQRRKGK